MRDECCGKCKYIHRLKHNFETGKGFQETYACDVLLHIDDGGVGWIQEVTPHGMCEMFTEEPTTNNNLGVDRTDMIDKSNFSQEQYKVDLQSAYDCGYAQAKNDLGVDCISRKAVERIINKWLSHTDYELKDHIYSMTKKIHNLPSVTQQEPRWIPVSERLPEEDGEYYATVYDTDEKYKYMDIAEFENSIWQYKDYIKVLAWMPLPKPYEPQESEDKE